jgi:hypothetical protein
LLQSRWSGPPPGLLTGTAFVFTGSCPPTPYRVEGSTSARRLSGADGSGSGGRPVFMRGCWVGAKRELGAFQQLDGASPALRSMARR